MGADTLRDLWSRVATVSRHAEATGALQPLNTSVTTLRDGRVDFQVRQLLSLQAKTLAVSTPSNPFRPYDAALHVTDWGRTHVFLLNKFKVVDQHILLITRDFVPQITPLSAEDFQAASEALVAGPALLFFNGGPMAGASQPHRHLQLVPLPLSSDPAGFPLGRALAETRLPYPALVSDEISPEPRQRAQAWLRFYRMALTALDLKVAGEEALRPYNLIATATRMAVIPRYREGMEGISVNALGFAGLLLVKNEQEGQRLLDIGPLNLLRQCCEPKPGNGKVELC